MARKPSEAQISNVMRALAARRQFERSANCMHCGASFTARSDAAKWCPACRWLVRAERRREKKAAAFEDQLRENVRQSENTALAAAMAHCPKCGPGATCQCEIAFND